MTSKHLLVVIDPTNKESQPALERATMVAQKTGASIELLVCDHNSALEDSLFSDKEAQQRARAALLAERQSWLEEMAEPLRKQGLKVVCKTRWGKPLYSEILNHVEETGPAMVFRNATTHGVLRRLLFNNTSWQLIRFCPVPLWLVRAGDQWQGKNIATAVDPVHSADKPASLDHQLIGTARKLGADLAMDNHYLHSYNPLPRSLVFEAELVVSYDSYLESTEQRHRQAFDELMRQHEAAVEQSHLLRGVPEETIPEFVEQKAIDLLVMGAISRGNLENALIGNTAERVLENSDCDLLVVKPAS